MSTTESVEKCQNKLSHKSKKTQLRNQKRKAKRQAEALRKKEEKGSGSEDEGALTRQQEAAERERQLQNILWIEREKEAQRQWQLRKEAEAAEKKRREEEDARIKAEWEERQRLEIEEQKKQDEQKKQEETLLKEATKNERKDGEDWHNPIAPVKHPGKEREACQFFLKTGACRYGDLCSRSHPYPETSCTILIPGMYSHFSLDQDLLDEEEYDTGIALEYDEGEKYTHFREFYEDVLSEFKNCGEVVQFKVACNQEVHLRGNVYVQYRREEEAEMAYTMFNGRWYAGKQLSCVYVDIAKWKSAICGLFFQRRCPKGKNCNFLHVFKNPGNEFWQANKDYLFTPRNNHFDNTDRGRYSSRRSRSPSRQSYNRARSRSPSRSYSRRPRSRSPSYKSQRRSRSPIRRNRRSRSPSRRSHRRDSRSRSRSPVRQARSWSRSPSRSRKRDSRKDETVEYISSNHVKSHGSQSPDEFKKPDNYSEDCDTNNMSESIKSTNSHKKKKKSKHKKKRSATCSPEYD